MHTVLTPNEQDLFIDILADMICRYLDDEKERQQRAAFWLRFFENLGIEARIVA